MPNFPKEVLKRVIRDFVGVLKVPFMAVKKIIGNVIASVDRMFEKLENKLLEMKRLALNISQLLPFSFSSCKPQSYLPQPKSYARLSPGWVASSTCATKGLERLSNAANECSTRLSRIADPS
jgi:hypothetical protein